MEVSIRYSDGRYEMCPVIGPFQGNPENFHVEDNIWVAYKAHIAQDVVFQRMIVLMESNRDQQEQLVQLRKQVEDLEDQRAM